MRHKGETLRHKTYLNLDKLLYQRIKSRAALEGTTIAELLERLMQQYLDSK